MHTPRRIWEAPRSRALAGLITGLAVAFALAATVSARQQAFAGDPPSDGPAVTAFVDPAAPDGVRGWRGKLTHVRLVPKAPGTVYYCWDQPIGQWTRASGDLVVPEGKHTLYATLVSDDVDSAPWLSVPFKVEYSTPVRAPSSAMRAAAGSGGTGTVTITATVNPHPGAIIKRIGGEDRYRTSQLISRENFTTSDTVILATGRNFADALTASGLAGCLNAPVMLVSTSGVQGVIDEMARLGATKVIIVGGTAAVPGSIVTQVSGAGFNVRRIGGADRYETASLIGREVLGYGLNGGRVYVARGDDFADALSLGPLAYSNKAPLLLVKPTAVPPSTRSVLSASAFSSGCIAGGTVAVSPQVAAEIGGYVGSVQRLAGETRYSTAVAVASWGVNSGLASYNTIGIATGTVFADALCGGVAIGSRGGVILLTRPNELSGETEAAIGASAHLINEVQVYGGEVAVTAVVMQRIGQILL